MDICTVNSTGFFCVPCKCKQKSTLKMALRMSETSERERGCTMQCLRNSDNRRIIDILAFLSLLSPSFHLPESSIDANKFGILQPNHQSILSDMILMHDA